MSLINYFSPAPAENELPALFLSPFNNKPHPLAVRASKQLQEKLNSQADWQHNFNELDGGKMFGVLVVRDAQDRVGYLSAFSGMLDKNWVLPNFVPPVFNQAMLDTFLPTGEAQLANYAQQINHIENDPEHKTLKIELEQLIQQRDIELTSLSETHKFNKNNRQQQRTNSNNISNEDKEKFLLKLSFESQEDKREKKSIIKNWKSRITTVSNRIDNFEKKIESLKKSRANLSKKLHEKVFSSYSLLNMHGEQKGITDFFDSSQPPGGTGDCAAPKLLQYANQHKLTPLAIAEFWWGASPANEIRHHGHFYPSCRGKCHPILPFMLKGLNVQVLDSPGSHYSDLQAPETVYEDDVLLVVNKPNGLLSVPGKEIKDSVLTRIQKRYPNATGPLLVHRLDMDTSGLLLIAKTAKIHKKLQQQFIQRKIEKRYIAILEESLLSNINKTGTIDLPIRVDFDDRPRQMVCFTHGKPAKTHWEIISREIETTRIYLYPVTGRTHQLRIHMAHLNGLNTPILGDRLYGTDSDRLYLHAERLCFIHPVTGNKTGIKAPAPF